MTILLRHGDVDPLTVDAIATLLARAGLPVGFASPDAGHDPGPDDVVVVLLGLYSGDGVATTAVAPREVIVLLPGSEPDPAAWADRAAADLRDLDPTSRAALQEMVAAIAATVDDDVTVARARQAVAARQGAHLALEAGDEDRLSRSRRVLGEDHPYTLVVESEAPGAALERGDYAAARSGFEALLAHARRALGEDHDITLTTRANLATTLRELGEHDAARRLARDLLFDRRRLLGNEHPATLSAMLNLAACLAALGGHARARALQERVRLRRYGMYGLNSGATLGAAGDFAVSLRALGELSYAKQVQDEVVDVLRRFPDEDRPGTLTAVANLAATRADLGDLDAAAEMEADVLARRQRVLGPDHPDTLSAAMGVVALDVRRDERGRGAPEPGTLLTRTSDQGERGPRYDDTNSDDPAFRTEPFFRAEPGEDPDDDPAHALGLPHVPDATVEPARWGRVDDDGAVWVVPSDGSPPRPVGSWRPGAATEALLYYARSFNVLRRDALSVCTRLAALVRDRGRRRGDGWTDALVPARAMRTGLATAKVVGDVVTLGHLLDAIVTRVGDEVVRHKRDLVAEAESLAEHSTEWVRAERGLRVLSSEWRRLPETGRADDDALGHRFTAARETFDGRRKAHRAELRRATRARTEDLVAEAESLAASSDWGPAAARYRELTAEWTAAGIGLHDALWARFRAAQDAFFAARWAAFVAHDPEAAARIEATRARIRQFESQARTVRAAGDPHRAEEAEARALELRLELAATVGDRG